ncbi:MAG: hypothetical protein WCQ95_01510 [Bacteroidota bacterium]
MAQEANYQNKIVTAVDSIVNVRKIPSFTSAKITSIKSGTIIGRSSGTTFNMDGDKWIQVNLTLPVGENKTGYVAELYQGKENVRLSDPGASPVAEQNAQKLIDDIVATDKQTYATLLACYNKIVALSKKNIAIPLDLQLKLCATYVSLSNRQKKIRENVNLKVTTGHAKDEVAGKNIASYINETRGGGGVMGIGELATILVLVIIALIATAATAATLYYIFKPNYSESTRDLKVSKELQKALDTLSPEDQKAVKEDLEKQIDDANRAGKNDQKFTDFFTGIPTKIILAVGGFLLVSSLLKNRKSKTK